MKDFTKRKSLLGLACLSFVLASTLMLTGCSSSEPEAETSPPASAASGDKGSTATTVEPAKDAGTPPAAPTATKDAGAPPAPTVAN